MSLTRAELTTAIADLLNIDATDVKIKKFTMHGDCTLDLSGLDLDDTDDDENEDDDEDEDDEDDEAKEAEALSELEDPDNRDPNEG